MIITLGYKVKSNVIRCKRGFYRRQVVLHAEVAGIVVVQVVSVVVVVSVVIVGVVVARWRYFPEHYRPGRSWVGRSLTVMIHTRWEDAILQCTKGHPRSHKR